MGSEFFEAKNDGVFIRVKIVPNSSKNEICGILDNALKIKIKAPAVENKANLELIKFLAKEIGVAKSAVTLVSGCTSKIKNIFIAGVTIEKIKEL